MQFCAIVNINLAVVNTLPLPALDGGYLVLLALEALRGGKKLPEKFEQVREGGGCDAGSGHDVSMCMHGCRLSS